MWCLSGLAGMTSDSLFCTLIPKLTYLLMISMVFLNCNISPSTFVPSLACSYAAEEPQFIKEGELIFLEKQSKERIMKIDIEIADSDYERTRGLMYRHALPANAGMLFIFEKPGLLSFWMRNTYIPLDIIFADGKKQIVSILKKTEPLSYSAMQSKKKAKYVIEVNAGFCDQHRIKVGDWITF